MEQFSALSSSNLVSIVVDKYAKKMKFHYLSELSLLFFVRLKIFSHYIFCNKYT